MKTNRLQLGIVVALIFFGVLLRIGPHPANFAPITAIALFGGAVLPRRYALLVPLLAMMASDLIIGLHELIPITWGSYALIALAASHTWLQKKSIKRIVGLALSSSVFFFLTTNFAVWLAGGLYEHTLTGLSRCFTLALPFFRNTLASDLIYTGIFFGLYSLTTRLIYFEKRPSVSVNSSI